MNTQSSNESRPGRRIDGGLVAFLASALALGALLAWPLRRGQAYLDDHVFLALARRIDAPWAPLLQDSLGVFSFDP